MELPIFDKRLPVYEQIVDYLRRSIASGDLEPGEVLASRREFAQLLQVNPNTVQRAYKALEDQGLITTGNNVTSKVTQDADLIQGLRNCLVDEAVQHFIQATAGMGLSSDQLLAKVQEAFNVRED